MIIRFPRLFCLPVFVVHRALSFPKIEAVRATLRKYTNIWNRVREWKTCELEGVMEKIVFFLNLLFLFLVFWKTRFRKLLPASELPLCILLVPANKNLFWFAVLGYNNFAYLITCASGRWKGRGLVSNTSFLKNKIFSYHILFLPITK